MFSGFFGGRMMIFLLKIISTKPVDIIVNKSPCCSYLIEKKWLNLVVRFLSSRAVNKIK